MHELLDILRLFTTVEAISLLVAAVLLVPFGIAIFLRGRGRRVRKV